MDIIPESVPFLVISILIFGIGLVSHHLKNSIITPPMVFVLVGILIGPIGLNLIDLSIEEPLIKTTLELTLVLVLFIDGFHISIKYLRQEYPIPARLLLLGMPLSVGIGAALFFLFTPSIGMWQAALLAALLTPTDAALCQVAVSNEHVPESIREDLIFESGMNDGMILPLILFLIVGESWEEGQHYAGFWTVFLMKQIGLGALIGIIAGECCQRLLQFGIQKEKMSHIFQQLFPFAAAIFSYAIADLLGGNGFISVFLAGIAFARKASILKSMADFLDGQKQLFSLLSFTILGASLLPSVIPDLSWKMFGIGLLALIVIRIGSVLISLIGSPLSLSDRLFVGWMGPRGIASLIYGLMILHQGLANGEFLFHAVIITVLMSVFLHGVTAVPLANWIAQKKTGRPN